MVSALGLWMISAQEALKGSKVTLLGSGSVRTESTLHQQRTTVSDPKHGKMSTWKIVDSMQITTVREVISKTLAKTAEISAGS